MSARRREGSTHAGLRAASRPRMPMACSRSGSDSSLRERKSARTGAACDSAASKRASSEVSTVWRIVASVDGTQTESESLSSWPTQRYPPCAGLSLFLSFSLCVCVCVLMWQLPLVCACIGWACLHH
jgi:hypothetical protein